MTRTSDTAVHGIDQGIGQHRFKVRKRGHDVDLGIRSLDQLHQHRRRRRPIPNHAVVVEHRHPGALRAGSRTPERTARSDSPRAGGFPPGNLPVDHRDRNRRSMCSMDHANCCALARSMDTVQDFRKIIWRSQTAAPSTRDTEIEPPVLRIVSRYRSSSDRRRSPHARRKSAVCRASSRHISAPFPTRSGCTTEHRHRPCAPRRRLGRTSSSRWRRPGIGPEIDVLRSSLRRTASASASLNRVPYSFSCQL